VYACFGLFRNDYRVMYLFRTVRRLESIVKWYARGDYRKVELSDQCCESASGVKIPETIPRVPLGRGPGTSRPAKPISFREVRFPFSCGRSLLSGSAGACARLRREGKISRGGRRAKRTVSDRDVSKDDDREFLLLLVSGGRPRFEPRQVETVRIGNNRDGFNVSRRTLRRVLSCAGDENPRDFLARTALRMRKYLRWGADTKRPRMSHDELAIKSAEAEMVDLWVGRVAYYGQRRKEVIAAKIQRKKDHEAWMRQEEQERLARIERRRMAKIPLPAPVRIPPSPIHGNVYRDPFKNYGDNIPAVKPYRCRGLGGIQSCVYESVGRNHQCKHCRRIL